MKTQKIFYYMLIGFIGISIMGCKTTNKDPFNIGMSKEDVSKKNTLLSEEHIITEPGQLEKGYRVITDNNIEFTLVFNNNDILSKISTSDQSYRLPSGVGVGSSFTEIKNQYQKYNFLLIPGYGRCVDVSGGIRFCFLEMIDTKDIMDNEKVKWVEFR